MENKGKFKLKLKSKFKTYSCVGISYWLLVNG